MAQPPSNVPPFSGFQQSPGFTPVFKPGPSGSQQPFAFPGGPQGSPMPLKPGSGYVPFQPSTGTVGQPGSSGFSPSQPPQESGGEGEDGVIGKLQGLVSKGMKLITGDDAPDSSNLPKRPIRETIQICSGLKDDYMKWNCPRCTLENSVEFIQCETCEEENLVLKAILEAIGRPGKRREKGKLEKVWGWFS